MCEWGGGGGGWHLGRGWCVAGELGTGYILESSLGLAVPRAPCLPEHRAW